MANDYEIGEFDEDGGLDERDSFIHLLAKRIEQLLGQPGFSGVDVSGVRANVAILATIIGSHGGGHLIKMRTVEHWAERIDEVFTNERLWGFTPWPEEVKQEWRAGCRRTVERLLSVLEDWE
jgi:hypothetical protein